MRRAAFPILLMFATAARAAPLPRLSDAEINSAVELGQEVEARGDGDLDADGHIDTAFIIGGEDGRDLYVVLAAPGKPKPSRKRVGVLKLDKPRVGKPVIAIANSVLKLEDTTGRSVRMRTTLRYRLDASKRMRLIGMEALRFRTAKDGDDWDISWNLLTGGLVSKVLRPAGSGDLPPGPRTFTDRMKRPSRPIYMEETPDPEFVMIDIHKK